MLYLCCNVSLKLLMLLMLLLLMTPLLQAHDNCLLFTDPPPPPHLEYRRRYCNEDTCPLNRGVCNAARGGSGDDYVTVSKCYCFYGYGGEACAQRVVSYVSMLWQVWVGL